MRYTDATACARNLSGERRWTVQVWSPARSEPPRILRGHTGAIWAMAPLPDGRIVAGSVDNTARV